MNNKKNTETIGIVGPGLIGASLGRNLTARGVKVICAGRSKAHLARARKLGACRETATGFKRLSGCGIIVICTPVDVIENISKKIIPLMKKGAVITDVGSVKTGICGALGSFAARHGVSFVGAHPMAGSEKSGCAHSSKDLFLGTRVFITPVDKTSKSAVRKVARMWRGTGARCSIMAPALHDEITALTSHLPHLISFCFTSLFLDYEKKHRGARTAAAGSFRDMTRISGSSPAVWNAVFVQNKANIIKHLDLFVSKLESLRASITGGRPEKILSEIKRRYETLMFLKHKNG